MLQKQKKKPKEELYFIAIIIEGTFGEEVTQIKQQFALKYNSKHALRSPPHITLHMPFKWRTDRIDFLSGKLSDFALSKGPFEVMLDGFGSFSPRVIYIMVKPSAELNQIQHELKMAARQDLKLVNSNYKDKAFHPHVTVAFRDLSKKNYNVAWDEYADLNINHTFLANSISLLKHNGKHWAVYEKFGFSGARK